MTFAETLREERLINRRSRARKARILGRLIGFALTACFVVALRSEPQLRAAVEDLALAAIGRVAPQEAGRGAGQGADAQAAAIASLGYAPGSDEARALETLGISQIAGSAAPAQSQLPVSRVQVNRGAGN